MDNAITIYKDIKLKDPILVAAWPGMGQVASKAAMYLKEKLEAKLFAKLKSEKFFHQSEVTVEGSLIKLKDLPEEKFYYWENKDGGSDLIIFISEFQPAPEKSAVYARAILDFIATLKVKMVFTFASMLTPIDHTQMPKAWLAVTHQKLIAEFNGLDVHLLESGQISGLNGLFLALAKQKKFQGACLLGEIPFYTAQIENPKSSLVVLNNLCKFLNISLDVTDLSVSAKAMEEEIAKLIEDIRHPSYEEEEETPITAEDIEKIKNILATQSQIPNSAKSQIEDLFVRAEDDLSCALELKTTLDEWNAYKDYEDRFLELFKKIDRKEN